jgi:GntR family transcriptional regulator / MocR family aminotransferase
MVLPNKWMTRYNGDFEMYQSPVSLIQQRIIQQFIHSGHWERHLRKTCIANKRKHDLLIRTIQKLMDDRVIIHGRNAGLHILLESSQGLTEREMIEKAKKRGVLVYPVSMFWLNANRYSNNMVLLGFGNVSEEFIVEGIKQLAKAWKGVDLSVT